MVIVFFSYRTCFLIRVGGNLGFLTSKSRIILLYTNSGASQGGAAAPSRPPWLRLCLHTPGYYKEKSHRGCPKMLIRSFETTLPLHDFTINTTFIMHQ